MHNLPSNLKYIQIKFDFLEEFIYILKFINGKKDCEDQEWVLLR